LSTTFIGETKRMLRC